MPVWHPLVHVAPTSSLAALREKTSYRFKRITTVEWTGKSSRTMSSSTLDVLSHSQKVLCLLPGYPTSTSKAQFSSLGLLVLLPRSAVSTTGTKVRTEPDAPLSDSLVLPSECHSRAGVVACIATFMCKDRAESLKRKKEK